MTCLFTAEESSRLVENLQSSLGLVRLLYDKYGS